MAVMGLTAHPHPKPKSQATPTPPAMPREHSIPAQVTVARKLFAGRRSRQHTSFIVRHFESWFEEGQLHIATEYFPLGTLRDLLTYNPRFTPEQMAWSWMYMNVM